jgi:cell division topological specificity factor
MGIFDFLLGRRQPAASTAGIAKERLQIVLSHERASRDAPSFLPALQRDLLAVIGKYVTVQEDFVRVNFARRSDTSMLEINVSFDPAATTRSPPIDDTRPTAPPATARFAPARSKYVGRKR